jgi:hypothetical protein
MPTRKVNNRSQTPAENEKSGVFLSPNSARSLSIEEMQAIAKRLRRLSFRRGDIDRPLF